MGGENRCEAQCPCGHLASHLSLHGNGVVGGEGAISCQPLQVRGDQQILHHDGSAGECEGGSSSGQCWGGQSDVERWQVCKDSECKTNRNVSSYLYIQLNLRSGSGVGVSTSPVEVTEERREDGN